MSQLLNKLKFQREQKQMDVSDNSLLYALQYLLSSIKEGWIFDNFSVTNINSKFNEIISQARNGSNRKPDTNQTKVLPVSNQLSSANRANHKQWSREQADMYWRNQLVVSMKSVSPAFTVDDSNRQLLKALYQWIWGMPGMLDLDKGLLLHGPIGVGKSTLLKGLQNYAAKLPVIVLAVRMPD